VSSKEGREERGAIGNEKGRKVGTEQLEKYFETQKTPTPQTKH